MKIRNKKQMNLPQLIEWLLNSKYSSYIAFSNMGNHVQLEEYGALSFSNGKFYPEETFTVEVEEEITEDTEISILAHYSVFGFKTTKSNASINEEKDGNSIAFYIMNDDKTMTLIWKNGKLVD